LGEGRKWTLQTGELLILSKSLKLGGEAFNVLGFNSHYKPHLPQPLCLLAIVIHWHKPKKVREKMADM
jgi:hypothetical protein